MGWLPTIVLEGKVFGRYILATKPNAKIGVLYQNDDLGRDALEALKSALGSRASEMIVSAQKYEVTDPTVDSQILAMKAAGADVLYNAATIKSAAQAPLRIRRVLQIEGRNDVSGCLDASRLQHSVDAGRNRAEQVKRLPAAGVAALIAVIQGWSHIGIG